MACSKTSTLLLFLGFVSFELLQVEAKSLKAIHELLTPDEREVIFSGPFPGPEVLDYDVIHPTQVDRHGNHLSRDLAHGNARRRRSLDSGAQQEPAFFSMRAFDEALHVNVSLNTDLFAPGFVAEVLGSHGSRVQYEIEHCHYTGHVISQGEMGAKVAVSNCDGLSGVIRSAKHGLLVVNPLPDRLGLNKNKTRAHVIYRRSARDVEALAHDLGMEDRADDWCGVTDDPNDKRQILYDSSTTCSPVTGNKYIETFVAVDYQMLSFHGLTQINKYVPTILNIAHSLLGDNSIGAEIKYVIKKLQIHESGNPSGLAITTDATATLSSFCQWSKTQNVDGDSNPDHFDHATLIARKSFVKSDGSPVLGLAGLSGMCNIDSSCTINQDSGLGSAFTIAHETGHNLGAHHDGSGNSCPGNANIMATSASGSATAFEWSTCSCNYVTGFLSTSQSSCLTDVPSQLEALPTTTQLPGQVYSRDDQCKLAIPDSTGFCTGIPDKAALVCTQLWCTKPDSTCTTKVEPAAEGTECGTRKWCRRGTCVVYGSEGPQAINGGYSAWGAWGACSHTCGGGVQARTRQCNSPAPQHGGALCSGSVAEYKFCDTAACAVGTAHTRDTQCSAKNNVQFTGGVTYTWRYEYNLNPVTSATQRCDLKCVSGSSTSPMINTFGKVSDGTRCDGEGLPGMCINNGQCMRLGCDNVLNSTAVEDRCGTCNGDGSGCTWNNATYNQAPDENGAEYQTIATIPATARNVYITEIAGPLSYNVLSLLSSGGQEFNTNNQVSYSPRTFSMAGTSFKYVSDANGKETFTAKGPLTQSVTLQFGVGDWYTAYQVFYAYLTPTSTVSVRGLDDFKWRTESQGCSASCGGGIEELFAVCERADDGSEVDDVFCPEQRPANRKRPCGTDPCPKSGCRWRAGQWTECTKTCNGGTPGKQTRRVECVIDSAGEEELELDSACKEKPKPDAVKECNKDNVCPALWDTVKAWPFVRPSAKGKGGVQSFD